jgi:hypothetical protein
MPATNESECTEPTFYHMHIDDFKERFKNNSEIKLCNAFTAINIHGNEKKKYAQMKIDIIEKLRFNETIRKHADFIISQLPPVYNGFHLRMEPDAAHYISPTKHIKHAPNISEDKSSGTSHS